MSWDYWNEYRPRIRPANGIRAKSTRGKFGETWWAGRWIAALERLTNEGRLARGRTYARAGQVVKLDVGEKGVAALVQGSMPKPYRISIRFRRLSDAEWEAVIDAMAAQALYTARLLAGEMPEQIEEVFAQSGCSLLPAEGRDLVATCSCPDWSNPCKHVAAVHYLLGERFDEDPFLMFELRGRSKEALLTALRGRRGIAAGGPAPEPETETESAQEVAKPLPADPAAFWRLRPSPGPSPAMAGEGGTGPHPGPLPMLGEGVPAFSFSFDPPAIDAVPVKRLGAPTFWQGAQDFTAVMEAMYRAIGGSAYDLMLGPEASPPAPLQRSRRGGNGPSPQPSPNAGRGKTGRPHPRPLPNVGEGTTEGRQRKESRP